MWYALCLGIGVIIGAVGTILFEKRAISMLEEIHGKIDAVLDILIKPKKV